MSDLSGKHGLIVGVANKRSISWAIAQALSKAGVRLALTYPSARLEENVRELAASLENPLVLPCDVANDQQIAELGAALDKEFDIAAAWEDLEDLDKSIAKRVADSRSTD